MGPSMRFIVRGWLIANLENLCVAKDRSENLRSPSFDQHTFSALPAVG
jgi:hypothetical protein